MDKRQEYENIHKNNNIYYNNLNSDDSYLNDIKLKFENLDKENNEIKNQILMLQNKLDLNHAQNYEIRKSIKYNSNLPLYPNNQNIINDKEKIIKNKSNKSNEINIGNVNDNLNGVLLNNNYQNEDINLDNLYTDKTEKYEEKSINKDKKDNTPIINKKISVSNTKDNDTININNEEINIFNKYLSTISENKNNQIELSRLQKEIEIKNDMIAKLEEKLKENISSKEKEKEEMKKLLDLETQKTLKLKELAEEQQKKNKKYKTKLEEYKKKSVSEIKENENLFNNSKYYVYRRGSLYDDNNAYKLKEDIFQLKQQLDEERSKTEVLKLLAENEKEKIENYKNKYNQTKKYNATLLNKLKERETAFNQDIINENNLLKKQLNENENKNNELKLEIQKLNKEIEAFKKEVEKIDNEEKIIMKENSILKNNLNLKDNIIKQNNNKLNEINIKYTEEKNKNHRLSLEIKELFYENKRLTNQCVLPKSNKDVIHNDTPLKDTKIAQNKKSKVYGTVLDLQLKNPKPNKKVVIRKVETMKLSQKKNINNEDKKSMNKNKSETKYKENKIKSSDKILNDFKEDYASSSEYSGKDNISEINKKKQKMQINIIKVNEMDENNTIKEKEESNKSGSSFSSSNF